MNPFHQTPSSSRGYHSAVGSNTDPRNNRRSGAFHPVQPPLQDLQQQLFQVNQQGAQSVRDFNDGASTLSSHHDSQREEWERNEIVQKRWLDKSEPAQFNFESNVWADMDTLFALSIETSVKQILLRVPVIKENSFMLEDDPRGCFVTRSLTDQLLLVVKSRLMTGSFDPTGETWQRDGNVLASLNAWIQAASENIASLTEAIQRVTQLENNFQSFVSGTSMLAADTAKLCVIKCQEIKKGFVCHREKLQHSREFIHAFHSFIANETSGDPDEGTRLVLYFKHVHTVFGSYRANEIANEVSKVLNLLEVSGQSAQV